MIKYAFDTNGRFKGRFTETNLEFIETAPDVNLFKPVINTDKTGWIEGLSATELAEAQENEAETLVDELLEKYEQEGKAYFKRLRTLIQRNKNDGTITQAQFLGTKETLQPALLPIKDGDWLLSQKYINAITPPTNAKMLFLYNKVKNDIDAYVLNMS